jgi:sugar diacid utilization regulator
MSWIAQDAREYIAQVIEGDGGAAERLGLHPNTLRHRLRKLGLKRPPAVSGADIARG